MLKTSLADQIYNIIKNRIVNLELKFGERIDIQNLEDEFSVSQTPILFALNKMQEAGLVENRPHVGYFVFEPTEKDIEDIYDIREMFEVYALKSAIDAIKAEELQQLKTEIELIPTIENEKERKDKFRETDKKLHLLFINRSDNKRAISLFLQVFDIITISIFLGFEWTELLEEHISLIEALQNKDLKEAKRILELHIRKAKMYAIKQLQTLNK